MLSLRNIPEVLYRHHQVNTCYKYLQVKEMEQIIRRRHPNSLPALIMTAAIAADDKTSLERTPTMIVLENQLKKLEAELETKDDESEKMLRSVEQKYNTLKVRTIPRKVIWVGIWKSLYIDNS